MSDPDPARDPLIAQHEEAAIDAGRAARAANLFEDLISCPTEVIRRYLRRPLLGEREFRISVQVLVQRCQGVHVDQYLPKLFFRLDEIAPCARDTRRRGCHRCDPGGTTTRVSGMSRRSARAVQYSVSCAANAFSNPARVGSVSRASRTRSTKWFSIAPSAR